MEASKVQVPINNCYYREEIYKLYHGKLYSAEISLKEVPEWLLEDTFYGKILYETSLNPNRCDFQEHYRANMEALEHGIRKAEQNGNVELQRVLGEIQEAHVFWNETEHEPGSTMDAREHESDPSKREQKRSKDRDLLFVGATGVLIVFLVVAFLILVGYILSLLRRI